jgi:hypothetical protein
LIPLVCLTGVCTHDNPRRLVQHRRCRVSSALTARPVRRLLRRQFQVSSALTVHLVLLRRRFRVLSALTARLYPNRRL